MKYFFPIFCILLLSSAGMAQESEAPEEEGEPTVSAISEPEKPSKYTLGKLYKSNKGDKLPPEVISFIEKKYLEVYRKQDQVRTDVMTEAEMIVQFRRQILDVSLFFKNSDRFFEKPIYFNLNQGGGAVALEDYFGNRGPGKFYFRILAKKPEDVESLDRFQSGFRVLFISNSIKQEVGGAPWGTGCGVFLDITDYFKKKIMPGSGILLTTAGDQHIASISGRFVIFYIQKNDVYMSMISFVDRNKPKIQCGYI